MSSKEEDLSQQVNELMNMPVPIIGRSPEWLEWERRASALGPGAEKWLMLSLAIGTVDQHYGAILALSFCGFEADLRDDVKPVYYEVRAKGGSEITKIIPVHDPTGPYPGGFVIRGQK